MTTAEFTRKCRELQGKFRERMGEPMGKGPIPWCLRQLSILPQKRKWHR